MPEAIRQGDIPGVQLRRRQSLAWTPEEAWRWLVEPAKLVLWLAEEAEVDSGPAGGFLLTGRSDGGELRRERGRTLEIVPASRWVLAFERLDAGWPAATRLELCLHPAEVGGSGGCELDVLQQGFQRLPLSVCLTVWEGYRLRWRTALARLADSSR
jgi:uncharacterized protein YndB with AHSA1/START domain